MDVGLDYSSASGQQKEQNCLVSELAHRRDLVLADAAGNNSSADVILTAHEAAAHAAQDGKLAGVGGVRQRAKNSFPIVRESQW
jgi:phosphoenolpyruvate carboxylase